MSGFLSHQEQLLEIVGLGPPPLPLPLTLPIFFGMVQNHVNNGHVSAASVDMVLHGSED